MTYAEGIFSIYGRVSKGRQGTTIDHLVALTRLAAHGPPAATSKASKLAGEAMKNFHSTYCERFCTKSWFKGNISKTVNDLQSKKWNW